MTSSGKRNKGRLLATSAFALILGIIFYSFNAYAIPAISDASIPQRGQAGSPIPIFVNTTNYNNDSYEVAVFYELEDSAYPVKVLLSLSAGNYTNGTWFGELPAQEWGGTISVSVVVDNGIARYPAQGSVSINVEGPRPSKINSGIILLVIFLIIAFVAIELALKPGFWRKTGRERARELEEEDRKREEEEQNAKKEEKKVG